MNYMLDTNICIYVIKHKPPSVLQRFHDHIKDGLCISSITLAELSHGVEKSEQREKNAGALLHLVDLLKIVPFDNHAAYEYGKICAFLQSQGTPIGTMDMLIAAHARLHGFVLITNNVREFSRVPGLIVENWCE